ncbi:MAG: hypothetical protein IJA87_05070 [Clostridia bacterium]|nr:hypothetical protein [Clostridia bacterium]
MKRSAAYKKPQTDSMLDIKEALAKIHSSLALTMKEAGFTAVIPEGIEKGEAPVASGDNGIGYRLEYKSEAAGLRIDYFDTKLNFSISTEVDGDGQFINYDLVSVSLLDPETTDQSDVNYISGEISDTVMAKFCKPDPAMQKVKAPKTVSKAAARSGSVYYDSNTLASRLTSSLYPEYRAQYNDNINRYGEFLPEEFFAAGCADAIIATIRQNDPAKMKKLFNLLNEIYLDATNETQSLIVVSILGKMDNDQTLLANCVDYMCDDLLKPTIRVNKFFATGAGKTAKEKLANPPAYKPKKAKRPSMTERMMSGAQNQQRK